MASLRADALNLADKQKARAPLTDATSPVWNHKRTKRASITRDAACPIRGYIISLPDDTGADW